MVRPFLGSLALLPLLAACAVLPTPVPRDAYYADPAQPGVAALAVALGRAAVAAGREPADYAFALLATDRVVAQAGDEGVFYFSDGLLRLPPAQVEALVAQLVAHDVLGHAGTRRALSLGISGGFMALGLAFPGAGLADFVVNPVIVRVWNREQVLEADQRALEILAAMGHRAPRRALARALRWATPGVGDGPFAALPDLEQRLLALEPLEPEPPAPLARQR